MKHYAEIVLIKNIIKRTMSDKAIEYIRKVYQIPNHISVYEEMGGVQSTKLYN